MKKYFFQKRSKVKQEDTGEDEKLRLPKEKELEMFGVVQQRMGGDQIKVSCDDGIERSVRIPGKLKKKVWVKNGDVVIIRLWEFQRIKADLVWRYLGFQVERLKKKGLLEKLPI